jgi:SEC-C motif-containing protein
MTQQLCPCSSGKFYTLCCQPFHKGKRPDNALQLMRSRYSAYACWVPSYIIATTHPANAGYSENRTQWVNEILNFCRITQFVGLKILEFRDGKQEAAVTFIASLEQEGQDASFQEKSRFLKVDGRWLYHSGQFFNR